MIRIWFSLITLVSDICILFIRVKFYIPWYSCAGLELVKLPLKLRPRSSKSRCWKPREIPKKAEPRWNERLQGQGYEALGIRLLNPLMCYSRQATTRIAKRICRMRKLLWDRCSNLKIEFSLLDYLFSCYQWRLGGVQGNTPLTTPCTTVIRSFPKITKSTRYYYAYQFDSISRPRNPGRKNLIVKYTAENHQKKLILHTIYRKSWLCSAEIIGKHLALLSDNSGCWLSIER